MDAFDISEQNRKRKPAEAAMETDGLGQISERLPSDEINDVAPEIKRARMGNFGESDTNNFGRSISAEERKMSKEDLKEPSPTEKDFLPEEVQEGADVPAVASEQPCQSFSCNERKQEFINLDDKRASMWKMDDVSFVHDDSSHVTYQNADTSRSTQINYTETFGIYIEASKKNKRHQPRVVSWEAPEIFTIDDDIPSASLEPITLE